MSFASVEPSPTTACCAGPHSAQRVQARTWRCTSCRPPAKAVARAGCIRSTIFSARRGGKVGAASCISRALASACCKSAGICCVSGMFFQYFRGISDVMAEIFTRAGLKILQKYVPQSASVASSGKLGRALPASNRSAPSSNRAVTSGVTIAQFMSAKRRAKKPAVGSTV